ncbi:hypothetical protein CRM22_002835 [Opisthorchis felineus]|uniref:Uncharacterized protein n=1 Tax=Opisthorchis felineus TaxID=147828 RepID=A0A4S2M479_OPIFE|nr:hypothetical protein CRM22_002835 [Opisthorchis felineus]
MHKPKIRLQLSEQNPCRTRRTASTDYKGYKSPIRRQSTVRRSKVRGASSEGPKRETCRDQAVGTSIDEYNICYAPLRSRKTREHSYRNLLVAHWLPMAKTTSRSQTKQDHLRSTTTGDVEELLHTWVSTLDSLKTETAKGPNN